MDFVWDEAKARSNSAKHGVTFSNAKRVFEDPNALHDIDHSDPSEERWRVIGIGGGDVLFVVYTEVRDDLVRLISARKATRHEQDYYYRQALP